MDLRMRKRFRLLFPRMERSSGFPCRISRRTWKSQKYSVTGEKELPGARMELWEEKEGGTLVDSWVSDRGAHVIKGKLNAGKNYVLVEKTAPDGYWKAEK